MSVSSPKIIVLMYHRIDEQSTDPWGICVTPTHFEEQVRYLKNHVPVIRAEEAVQQVQSNRIGENCVCITFDDGYADNVVNALPILSKYNCPATFFIATSFTGSPQPYWWDELEMICLHTKILPSVLQIVINGQLHSFDFETELTEKMWELHKAWKWYEEPPTKRCEAFLGLWNLFRPFALAEIFKKMSEIRDWSGSDFHCNRLPADERQLQELANHKLTTIGLHTHTHIDLASKTAREQEDDILKGKTTSQHQYGMEANLLAYPYGRFNEETLLTIQKLDMEGCFTTEAVPVIASSQPGKLGRYQVFDWNGQEFGQQLSGWLSA